MLHKWKIIFSSLCMLILCSCHFPVHILTDEQIAKHYANRTGKPELKYLDYKNAHIHYAIVGDSAKTAFADHTWFTRAHGIAP